MKSEGEYILYIYVSNELTKRATLNTHEARESMSVLNAYDINMKANMISEELKKVDSAENDESCILFKEMQLMAMNNMQRFKLGLKK